MRRLLLPSLMCLVLILAGACTTSPVPPRETRRPPESPASTPVLIKPETPDQNEPVLITGRIPFTSPFFLDTTAEPFVLLEDEAGFVLRDLEFEFPLNGQTIGPVQFLDDSTLSFSLSLPAVPQGTLVDLDNDGAEDTGVMVFAVAYWSNTWGGPFLEPRDGQGWSNAYTSALIDPNREDEIVGGTLVVWSPDDSQGFPTGFGDDNLLFTEDDPIATIPAGYSLVNLDQEPFRIYKEVAPELTLVEGAGAVSDFSNLSYGEAFLAMFDKASREYPFTSEKGIDWSALRQQFVPRAQSARNDDDFYRVVRDFTYAIPDAHVGVSFNAQVFFEEHGGSFGMLLAEMNDGRVIVNNVLPAYPAGRVGIQVGAEILEWDGVPVGQALDAVQPYLGPYSTDHHRRIGQLISLTRYPPNESISVRFRNPGQAPREEILMAEIEYDSLLLALPGGQEDELALPVQGELLDEIGLGYIKISSFRGDSNLLARLWEAYLKALIESEVPGLIIDLRENGGGFGGLANDFAGFFFDEEAVLFQRSYFNELTDRFEVRGIPVKITPAPLLYEGPIAVLVSPDCVSACEGFAHALTVGGRSLVVGHAPTSGAFGEVGRGQYELPGDLSMQFPTGRPETPSGELLLEGVGVIPDILVPVTEDSALGRVDAVLEAAIAALLEQIGP